MYNDIKSLYQPQLKKNAQVYLPGVYDIDIKDYHKSAGVSRSGITELKRSPMHFWQKYVAEEFEPSIPSPEMIMGDVIHTLIMEPQFFDDRFYQAKHVDGRTKEGKQYKEDLVILAEGKSIIYKDDYDKALAIVDEVKKHPLMPKLLRDASFERSIYWVDSETEILCKARPDIWIPGKLIDLKTTEDATLQNFALSVRKYNYHIQAAMQIDAIKEITGELVHYFIFVAIPKTKPYKPYFYTLGDAEIERGREEYKDLLKVLRACYDKDKWDADRDQFIDINLPSFFFNNEFINKLLEVYHV